MQAVSETAPSVAREFAHVRTWVFDLDNTLYPPEVRLFDQIEVRMRTFMTRELGVPVAEADRLRREYWSAHGTTLAGLMAAKVAPDSAATRRPPMMACSMKPCCRARCCQSLSSYTAVPLTVWWLRN